MKMVFWIEEERMWKQQLNPYYISEHINREQTCPIAKIQKFAEYYLLYFKKKRIESRRWNGTNLRVKDIKYRTQRSHNCG